MSSATEVLADLDQDDAVLPKSGVRLEDLRLAAAAVARAEVSDALVEALNADGRNLHELQRDSGLDPAFVSRLARGQKGANVTSVALIALALGKSLRISIE